MISGFSPAPKTTPMKILKLILGIFLLGIFAVSCGDKNKEPGIETQKEETTEIKELTSAEEIKKNLKKLSTTSENTVIQNLKLTDSFYQQRNYNPIWDNRELREDLFRSIANSKSHGLQPIDYHGEYLEKSLSNLSNLSSEEKNTLELILSDAFFTLANHLNSGKLNPSEIYSIWDIEANETNFITLLEKAVSENDIASVLKEITPQHIVYKGLQKSLQDYEVLTETEGEITKTEDGETIKPDEKSERLNSVAKRLIELDFLKVNPLDSTNTYNEELQNAVKEFQESNGIETDAVIGAGTIAALNTTAEDRYNQILVNLERWRWYPRNLGDHYIIVNIPNYRLHVVKEEDTVASHRTMVGTEARKTPVFSDQIEHIVYNPTWTIPPTIKKNDVIPAASKNSSYLSGKNMAVFDSNGSRVSYSDIDWKNALKYTFRQEAGSANPLGRVKIIYPNKHMIYLHDTPSKDLFKKNLRARSSGCVRVEGVLDLAAYLLDDQEKYDSEKIQKIIDSGKTTTIKVTKDVKVHHLYWTAWKEDDQTRFAEDVYKLDKEVYEKLINSAK